MPIYTDAVNIINHADKGIALTKARKSSPEAAKFTAESVEKITDLAIKAAVKHKTGLCRYSFYIPGVNEKLPKDARQIPVAKVKAALADSDNTPLLLCQKRFRSNPQVVISKFQSLSKPTGANKQADDSLIF